LRGVPLRQAAAIPDEALDCQKIPEDQTGSIRPLVTPLSKRDMGVRRLAVDEVLANRVRSGTKQP